MTAIMYFMLEPTEYTFNLLHILFGSYPPEIFLEIILRVTIILMYTYIAFKVLGKRAAGEMRNADAILVIALGSAVGDALFYPSIPLIVSLTVVTAVIVIDVCYNYLTKYNRFFKYNLSESPTLIVKNGEMMKENIRKVKLNHNDVRMLLRHEGIEYLEDVNKAYLEPSGKISVFKNATFDKTTSILP